MLNAFIRTSILFLFMSLFITSCGLLSAPEEASGEIEAIPLILETATTKTSQPDDSGTTGETETVIETETETEAGSETAVDDNPSTGDVNLTIFQISQADSHVRFELDEDLRGNRITVVGGTNQVAAQLAVDFNNPQATQVGIIQINARTLATDNDFRNRAIQNEILDTGSYEFITFEPTALSGLPQTAVNSNDTVTFTIEGTLTIRDISQTVTFDVEVTAVSATQLRGIAQTSINRTDFGLNIPSAPGVANVEEEVDLIIEFTANANS